MSSNLVPDEETPLSDGELIQEVHNGMMDDNELELADMAYRALHIQGLENDVFVIVCIQLEPQWRALVEEFIPDFDWDATFDSEKFRYVMSRVPFSFCESLCEYFPDDTDILMTSPSDEKVRVIAIAGGDFSLYKVDPYPLQLQ